MHQTITKSHNFYTNLFGLSNTLLYLNKATGEYIPYTQFNDQVFCFSRKDADLFDNLVDDCTEYVNKRVPLTPETILYFHLCVKGRLKVKYMQDWIYEIVRSDDVETKNINDLIILDLVDRYHPEVKARARKRPLWYFMKYAKLRIRDIKRRLFQ